jgi:hypothetical protein
LLKFELINFSENISLKEIHNYLKNNKETKLGDFFEFTSKRFGFCDSEDLNDNYLKIIFLYNYHKLETPNLFLAKFNDLYNEEFFEDYVLYKIQNRSKFIQSESFSKDVVYIVDYFTYLKEKVLINGKVNEKFLNSKLFIDSFKNYILFLKNEKSLRNKTIFQKFSSWKVFVEYLETKFPLTQKIDFNRLKLFVDQVTKNEDSKLNANLNSSPLIQNKNLETSISEESSSDGTEYENPENIFWVDSSHENRDRLFQRLEINNLETINGTGKLKL